MSGALAPWICPTCDVAVATTFCSTCGEKHKDARDFTIAGLAAMAYNAFSPIDGKVLRSFITLFRKPGGLTVAFQRAQRVPFMAPFPLFLLANVFFFAVESAGKMHVFTHPLAQRLQDNEFLRDTSRALVDAHLAKIAKTVAEYAPLFDQAVAVHAKSLIGLMVPPFALLLPLVFWRHRQPLAVHIVFSLHFYAFFLTLCCVPLIAMEISALLGGPATPPGLVDDAMSVGLLISCTIYLYLAMARVYAAHGASRILQTLVLTTAVVGIFLLYRAILLPITLATT